MKKLFISLVFLSLPVLLMAHAPKKVLASYDVTTNTLTLDINHPVKDVNSHFIINILISQGDNIVKEIALTKQSSATTEHIEVKDLKLEKGQSYDIKAGCNKIGSKTITITITE